MNRQIPAPLTNGSEWSYRYPVPAASAPGDAPKISVITPSYNQGRYLEATIRSVLLQNYPNIEYIVIDGGSTDGSRDILEHYSCCINYWVSEPDKGQADAINKGLKLATGSIVNFINSDDLLAPGAVARVAELFAGHDAVAGVCVNFSERGETAVSNNGLTAAGFIRRDPDVVFHQPAVWLRRECIEACGGFGEYYCYFDLELMVRYLSRFPRVRYSDAVLAYFRVHDESKTGLGFDRYAAEYKSILETVARGSDAELSRAADHRLRIHDWWEALDRMQHDSAGAPLRHALRIMAAVMADPRVRLSRFSLGAIRRALSARQPVNGSAESPTAERAPQRRVCS